MRFSVDERLFHLFPFLKIGIVVSDINNTRYGEDRLETIVESTREHFGYENPEDHPYIRIWHEAFNKLGIPPSKYWSSVERLLRQALKGGPFPRFSPVIDLYNAISLKHLIPVGGHDITYVLGDISLTFAEGTEVFVPMDAGGQEVVERGEVVYRDDREVLTRRWVWRQSNKDRVSATTTRILISIDFMEGLREGLCDEVLSEIAGSLEENGIGKVLCSDLLSMEKRIFEFAL